MTDIETNDALAAFNGDGNTPAPSPSALKLSDFEGLPVTATSIVIPGAGGGLRDPLKVDPVEFRKGQRFTVVFDCVCEDVRHHSIDKGELDGPQERIHYAGVLAATIIDRDKVAEDFERQAARLAEAGEIAGQQKADFDAPWLGYDELDADEVVARLDDADSLDLVALVETYETANGGRAPVLEACVRARSVLEGTKPKRGRAKKATAG